MSIATAPPIGENGDNCGVNEPIVEELRVVEGGGKFRVEVEDRDPNRINEHLRVRNKIKLNAILMSLHCMTVYC